MCGTDVADKCALSWRGDCHTSDASVTKTINGKDYTGKQAFVNNENSGKGIMDIDNPRDITGGYLLERNYGEKL